MNKKIVRAAFAALLLGSTASVAMVSFPAAAADKDKDKKPPEKSISKSLYKPMIAVQKAVKESDWAGAMASLKEAQAIPDRTPYDDYKINQFIALVAANLKDFPTTTTAYEAIAASPEEEASEKLTTRRNLVMLEFNAKDYAKTLKFGEEMETMGPLDSRTMSIMATAYLSTNNYAKAEEFSRKAIDAAVAANTQPTQEALGVLLSAQVKQNKQADAAKTLELLATNYGTSNQWSQLTDLALGTPGIQNSDGIDLYRLRDAAGAMKDANDYALMSQIAVQLGYPGEAKTILDQGIAATRITSTGMAANLYKTAVAGAATDDKTLPKFAAEAAARKTGDYDEKLAETYFGYKRYAEAETAARRSLTKPGGKDPLQAKMVLAMSLARQDKYQDALVIFKEVEDAGGRAARVKAAHLWVSFCHSKMPAPAPTAAVAAPAAAPAPQPQQ